MTRALYTDELRPLLAPRSVVIVGVSSRPSSFGRRTLDNLAGADVEVFGVHPDRIQIDGCPTYASVAELPKRPDCAVIAVPRDAVEAAVLDCARAGIRGALVFASGYAETGRPEHAELQRRLTAIARDHGIRILGPNCMGILGGLAGMRLTFGEAPALRVDDAAIGLVSQSGGLGFAMAQASAHGQSFSHVFTAGNSCDVDVADQISFLVDQPECRVIACLFEGMPDPLRLLAAGERALAAGKPVVIFKIAVGEEGGEAAMSHTGSMAGSTTVYRAAFEHCGFVE
ncbi:MAG: CoA-binding protein, partial [Burkholderiales bacterium]